MEKLMEQAVADCLYEADCELFKDMLNEMQVGAILLRMMRQDEHTITDFKYEFANGQAIRLLGDDP